MLQSSEQPYTVRIARTPNERAAAAGVRMTVFVQEQRVPVEEEMDAYDETAIHFIATANTAGTGSADSGMVQMRTDGAGDIIGTARLVDLGEGCGKIGRVAVMRAHRGRGVGARLMAFAEETACKQGMREVILDAQCQAIPFYERLGYRAEGDIFLDAAIEHRRMRKQLAI